MNCWGSLEAVRQDDAFGQRFVEGERTDDIDDVDAGGERDLGGERLECRAGLRVDRGATAAARGALGSDRDRALAADRGEFVRNRRELLRREDRGLDGVGDDTLLGLGHTADGGDADGVLQVVDRVEAGEADLTGFEARTIRPR